MRKKRIFLGIPILIAIIFVISCWINLYRDEAIAQWQHFVTIVFLLIIINFYFTNFTKTVILTGVFFLAGAFGFAQSSVSLNEKQGSIEIFIPEGYSILDSATGDLNLDPYPDMLLVLKKNGEDSTSDVVDHPEKRPLLILIGQTDKQFKLAARNDNAVYCVNCGGMMGDPYMEIVIKKGYFSIEHYGGSAWRWTRIITFKYSTNDKQWYLYKDGSDSYHTSDPDKVETKIRTTKEFGKTRFEKFNLYTQ